LYSINLNILGLSPIGNPQY